MSTRHVLVIGYYFPPLGGAGVQRTVKYVKHLESLDWQAYIIAANKQIKYPHDDTMVDEIPKSAEINRPWSLEPLVSYIFAVLFKLRLGRFAQWINRWCFIPDEQILWLPFAYFAARRIVRQKSIDVIYTTSSPYTAHLVGYLIKRTTGKPWVADFRDEWTRNPFITYASTLHLRVNQWLERQVLEAANRVTTISEPICEGLTELVSPVGNHKFSVITNGYDAEEFAEPAHVPNEKFVFAYVGSFYGHRTGGSFLDALAQLLAGGQVSGERVKVVLVGNVGNVEGWKDKLGTCLQVIGYLPHSQAIRQLQNASALLLIQSSSSGRGSYGGKIFEYIASGTPILALAPLDGVAAELVRTSKTGVVVDPDDVEGIKQAICDLYQKWLAGTLEIKPDWSVIEQYERGNQARKLKAIFEAVIAE